MKNTLASFFIVVLFIFVAITTYNVQAASVTGTESVTYAGRTFQMVEIAATVSTSGTYTTDSYYGYLTEVYTTAGAGTSASYDITITDPNRPGADLMGGALGDRSVTTGEVEQPLQDGTPVWRPVHGPLQINYSNAGAAGVITVILDIHRDK